MKENTTETDFFIDPVCLMQVDPGKKDLILTYRMRTYHFCAEACRETFEADPEKYLAQKTSEPKGWWGRYLERLNKITGGKTPKCCH